VFAHDGRELIRDDDGKPVLGVWYAPPEELEPEPPYPLPPAIEVQPPVVPGEPVYRRHSDDGRWYPVREPDGRIMRYGSDATAEPVIVTPGRRTAQADE